MSTPIYFNSLIGKKSKYGIRISGRAEDVIEEIQKHMTEQGYINLEIKEMKQEGKYGKTHYLVVDTYTGNGQGGSPPSTPEAAPQNGLNSWTTPTAPEEDDLPF